MNRSVSTLLALLLLSACAADASAQDDGKREGVPGGIYDKPYITRMGRGTALGGYMDHELRYEFDADLNRKTSTFRQHRFIPFLYSEVTDRLHVAAEIEFEYGGNPEDDGEIKIEYAATDFMLREWLVFRGGIILSPLGYFNLVHDSPWNDLTERPLVNTQIIPTTLSESGMGFHGALYPSAMQVLNYELYLVNGFNAEGVKVTDGVPTQVRLRSARGNHRADNNTGKSLVGRLSWSPRLGVQLGGSFHTGAYDNASDDRASILAADAQLTRGPVQIMGEFARSSIGLERFGYPTQVQHGFYAQAGFHVPADALLEGSVFTLVGRYDYLDFGVKGDIPEPKQDRITLGLNFRPVEDTVFKLDWGFNSTTSPAGFREARGSTLFFSLATYF